MPPSDWTGPDAELIAIKARRHQDSAARSSSALTNPALTGLTLALTVSINSSGAPERGAPSLDDYDQLLAGGGDDPLAASAVRPG